MSHNNLLFPQLYLSDKTVCSFKLADVSSSSRFSCLSFLYFTGVSYFQNIKYYEAVEYNVDEIHRQHLSAMDSQQKSVVIKFSALQRLAFNEVEQNVA